MSQGRTLKSLSLLSTQACKKTHLDLYTHNKASAFSQDIKLELHFLLKLTLFTSGLSAVSNEHKTFWDLNHLHISEIKFLFC